MTDKDGPRRNSLVRETIHLEGLELLKDVLANGSVEFPAPIMKIGFELNFNEDYRLNSP